VKTKKTSKEVMFRAVVVLHANLRTFTVFERSSLISLHLLLLLPSSHWSSYQITEPKAKANGEVCDQSSLYDFMNVLAIIVERYLILTG